ncbi:hypothetical protein V3F56_13715 [Moorellaceae bacterium AZ2]
MLIKEVELPGIGKKFKLKPAAGIRWLLWYTMTADVCSALCTITGYYRTLVDKRS